MKDTFVELLQSNEEHVEKFQGRFDHVQESQQPEVVTVCCSDSRVLQDHMWGNQHPGKLFTCSNIGNRTFQQTEKGKTASGDILYPVEHTGTELAIVVGHTGCGAVTATYKDLTEGIEEPAGIRHSIDLIGEEIREAIGKLPEDLSETEEINYLVEYNVDTQVEFLLESENIPEQVDVVGVVYDFQDVYSSKRGKIHVINVNGEKDPETIKQDNPEIESKVNRLWSYQ